ncbi:hypothetical protein L6164_011786 [Bauhinia variegata]|uniref:Uncharacterized protein n=1 Tax=Bauhinia variegata TaxID=167791 RepID=A0ACB9P828_BAUVA|nr:hypothetical protein L6164_011786 [Bauhinia variegata]
MGDLLNPSAISPPPPPSPSPKSKLPMLYYGLVVVGTAAIVLVIYNFIVVKRCSRRQMQSRASGSNRMAVEVATSRSFDSSNRTLLSSFKYKKEQQHGGDGVAADYECPVCLSVFEEGEQVTKLPRCNHSFHSPCISMWLYSHFDCPICRTPVGPFGARRFPPVSQSPAENSREGLLESGVGN